MNRESESSAMRPLAKALTKALENVRNLLREQCLRGNASNIGGMNELFGERLQEALKIFDRLFADFELCYVSAMVPVKSTQEYELQQFVVVLFSETLQRYSGCCLRFTFGPSLRLQLPLVCYWFHQILEYCTCCSFVPPTVQVHFSYFCRIFPSS